MSAPQRRWSLMFNSVTRSLRRRRLNDSTKSSSQHSSSRISTIVNVSTRTQETEHSIEPAALSSHTTVFTPLHPDEFRLLRIVHVVEPPAGTETSATIFKCEVRTFPLERAPPFKAISYTWGAALYETREEPGKGLEFIEPPEPTPVNDRVFVNGHAVSINRNLYLALCYLYRHKALEPHAWLWADALCIDQRDPAEKSLQVGSLYRFFPAAKQVLVWLGESGQSAEYERGLAHFINDFARAVRRAETLLRRDIMGVAGATLDEEVIQALQIDNLNSRVAEVSTMIGAVRWFHRLWPGQEFATAQHLRSFLGSAEIDLDKLMKLQSHLRVSGWVSWILDHSDYHIWYDGIERMHIVASLLEAMSDLGKPTVWESLHGSAAIDRERHKTSGSIEFRRVKPLLLASMLAEQSSGACADPKDKVYGNQGLIEPALEGLEDAVAPDYSASIEEVFLRIGRQQLLLSSQTLDVIAFSASADRSTQSPVLPSWVTDYRVSEKRGGIIATLQPELNLGGGLRAYTLFDRNSDHSFKVGEQRIKCHGICIDRVQHVPDWQIGRKTRANTWTLKALDVARMLFSRKGAQRTASVLLRTLCYDVDQASYAENLSADDLAPHFWHWVLWSCLIAVDRDGYAKHHIDRLALQFKAIIADFELGPRLSHAQLLSDFNACCRYFAKQQSTLSEIESQTTEADIDSRADKVYLSGMRFASNRGTRCDTKLILTDKGAMVRAGVTVEQDDEIWALKSATHPWILRPAGNGDHYFIGPCFILPGQLDLPSRDKAEKLVKPVTLI